MQDCDNEKLNIRAFSHPSNLTLTYICIKVID